MTVIDRMANPATPARTVTEESPKPRTEQTSLRQASRRGERPAQHRLRRRGASGTAAWATAGRSATQSGRRPTGRWRPHGDGRPAAAAALGADKSAMLAGRSRSRSRHPCRTPAIIHVLRASTVVRSPKFLKILRYIESYGTCMKH